MIPATSRFHPVALGYSLFLSIWFGLWLRTGDTFWWMMLLNRAVPYLFLPTLPLFGWALFRRHNRGLLLLCVPTILFLFLYWPYTIPRLEQHYGAKDLRVMTYNLLYSNNDHQPIISIIETYQPDLVALQEVQPAMMAALTKELYKEYRYSLMGFEHPYGTTATFSRYPVSSAYVLDLHADRPAIVMKLNTRDRTIVFANVHLLAYGLNWVPWYDIPQTIRQRTYEQNRQAQRILEEITHHQADITILACDCNSQETSSSYRLLNRSLTNTAREVGWAINAPALPNARRDSDLQHIDYIFYGGEIRAQAVYIIQDSGGSDHWPLIADLSFVSAP